jgi:hypothetical protein
LVKTWEKSLDEGRSDLSEEEELKEEARNETKEEVAPSLWEIHDVSLSVLISRFG